MTDTAPTESAWPVGGLRFFATAADEPRSRRASDITLLAVSTIGLAAATAAASPPPAFVRSLDRFARAVPDFLDAGWQIVVGGAAVLAVGLLLAALLRRRLSVARDLTIAAVLAAVVWLVIGRVVAGS